MNGVPVVLDHPTANLALEGGGLNLTSSRCQVWSLTQFHSVAFLQFEDKRKIVLFTSTIKVRVSCFRQCPGATQEATFRALEGRRINYKTDILGRFFSDDFSAIPSREYEIHWGPKMEKNCF